MSHLEDRLLAKIEAFNGQIGDLRMDAIDHERRINDQDQRINELKSNLLKMESVHKGYKDTTNELLATLCTDVNDTCAKIPESRREVQDSAVELCREYQDSAAGLATSIKEVTALIPDLRQQQQEPVNSDTTTSAATPVRGASVDPPPTPTNPYYGSRDTRNETVRSDPRRYDAHIPPTPGLNRFNLPGGINPTFRGAASFPSGNCQTCATEAPLDPGAHQTNQSIGGPYATATPSGMVQANVGH